jgi:aspartate/methionine/tyrosine aminotransferase
MPRIPRSLLQQAVRHIHQRQQYVVRLSAGVASEPPTSPSPLVPSQRAQRTPAFVVMQVMEAAAKRQAELDARGLGERVLHLEVGQPASGAPAQVVQAAINALQSGPGDPLGYTSALGDDALRSKIAGLYMDRYGVKVSTENVAVCTGSSGAFMAVFASLWDAGDRVVCALPGYPCYRNTLGVLGITVVPVETDVSERFTPTVQQLEDEEERGGPLAGLILASPGNPTGCTITRERMNDLAAFCASRNIPWICDEIYHGISPRLIPSALEVAPDTAIVISSFSKYWSMSGWRLGFVVCKNTEVMNALERVLQNIHISAPTISQRAALAAFDCEDELEAHVTRYLTNMAILTHALPALGFAELYEPDGAFYIYCECSNVMDRLGLSSSVDFCREILAKCSVACTPGSDFDPARGHRYIRLSVAGSTQDIIEARDRLINWLGPPKKM